MQTYYQKEIETMPPEKLREPEPETEPEPEPPPVALPGWLRQNFDWMNRYQEIKLD